MKKKIYRLIKNLGIEEWPLFFNVLRGDLSLFGPMAEKPEFLEYYNKEQRQILKVRPGLIGPFQFFGVNWVGVILSVIVALIWLSVARQLWRVDPQGWLFVVVIAIVYLIFDFVAVLGGSAFQAVLPSVIVNAVALILAVLPNTRAAFGQS